MYEYQLSLLVVLLLVQYSTVVSFAINSVEGAGVCGCEFSCESFRNTGATTCYIIYREDGTWQHEEYQLDSGSQYEPRECISGSIREHCYMFVAYGSYSPSISCLDSHRACQRASGSIATMDNNNELYEFSHILINNIADVDLMQTNSFKTLAGNIQVMTTTLKNTCATVNSMGLYYWDIRSSRCQDNFKPMNAILCENTPISINAFCPTIKPTILQPNAPTKWPSKTRKIWSKDAPFIPRRITLAASPITNDKPWPTSWHYNNRGTFLPSTQVYKKKKMVINHNEPHNGVKNDTNITQLVAGIFFVGTIVAIGFAVLVVCFLRNRQDEYTDRNKKWSDASYRYSIDPHQRYQLSYTKPAYATSEFQLGNRPTSSECIDHRNAISDYEEGYSVINVGRHIRDDPGRRGNQNKPHNSNRYSNDKSKPSTSRELDSAQDYVTSAYPRQHTNSAVNTITTSRARSISNSKSLVSYEIDDLTNYDYSYECINSEIQRVACTDQYYVIESVDEPSYEYENHSSRKVKPKGKKGGMRR